MTNDNSDNPFSLSLTDVLRPPAILLLPPNGHPEQYTQLVQARGGFVLISSRHYRTLVQILVQEFPELGIVSPSGIPGHPSRFRYTEGPTQFVVDPQGRVLFTETQDSSPQEPPAT